MKSYEVIINGSFYNMTEAQLLDAAKRCDCERYNCWNCQCRKKAQRLGLLPEDKE